jgi:hypothetical protein
MFGSKQPFLNDLDWLGLKEGCHCALAGMVVMYLMSTVSHYNMERCIQALSM